MQTQQGVHLSWVTGGTNRIGVNVSYNLIYEACHTQVLFGRYAVFRKACFTGHYYTGNCIIAAENVYFFQDGKYIYRIKLRPARPLNEHMNSSWSVVWAIEELDLDQVLSRKRPFDCCTSCSSRWGPPFGVLFVRASPCSPLPTLPGAASAVFASSRGDGCCFG